MNENETTITAVSVRISDVAREETSHLWPGVIARRKLTLFYGDPGATKSQLTLDLAARTSKGANWPDGKPGGEPASVVILANEDTVADVIRPRLEAGGADLTKIHNMRSVEVTRSVKLADKTIAKKTEREFDLATDIPALRALLKEIGDVALVIIDPITAYQPKVNTNQNNEVRSSIVALTRLAEEFNVAVIAVMHMNKDTALNAIYRPSGSVAYMALARAAYLVAKTPNLEKPTWAMVCTKLSSGGPVTFSLTYGLVPRVLDDGFEMPGLEYGGPTTLTAQDLLTPAKSKRDGQTEFAKNFLETFLADGPKLVKDVEDEAFNKLNIAPSTLRKARRDLRIVSVRNPEFQGQFTMSLRKRSF